MTLYGSSSGTSKKINKLYGSVNGLAKEVQKLYGSHNGVSKLIYEKNDPNSYIELELLRVESGMVLQNRWNSPIYIVNTRTGASTTLAATENYTLYGNAIAGDKYRVYESNPNVTFRNWLPYNATNGQKPFIGGAGLARIVNMPLINRFTTNETGTAAGSSFFYYFNYNGKLCSLPQGSLDTRGITNRGNGYFDNFNKGGLLPVNYLWHVNIYGTPSNEYGMAVYYSQGNGTQSNRTVYNNDIAKYFGRPDDLIDYIEIEFDASGTATLANQWDTTVQVFKGSQFGAFVGAIGNNSSRSIAVQAGDKFFIREYYPGWTFGHWNTSTGTGRTGLVAGASAHIVKMPPIEYFYGEGSNLANNGFACFNQNGTITSLPTGSFTPMDLNSTVGSGQYMFYAFNKGGALTSLPSGSFNFKIGWNTNCFAEFNYGGALTSLPLSFNVTSAGTTFGDLATLMKNFNYNGKIPKSTTSYCPQTNPGTYTTFHYWNGSSSTTGSVSRNSTIYWYGT